MKEFETGDAIEQSDGKWEIIDKVVNEKGFFNLTLQNKKGIIKKQGGGITKTLVANFEKAKQEKRFSNKKDKFLRNRKERAIVLKENIKKDVDFTEKYYQTLGFLARNAEMNARLPIDQPGVVKWFDERYYTVKGEYPEETKPGYILRKSDKLPWGTQIQIIFKLPVGKTTEDIVLEPGMVLVKGKSYDELKPYSIHYKPYSKTSNFVVNGNELCWELLEFGFDFCSGDLLHNIEEIKSHIPEKYIEFFDKGI